MTNAAPVLIDFMPAEDLLRVAEAVIRVFHERGDYQHRQRNRMKFLIKAMGWDGFRAAFEAALAQVRAEGVRDLAFEVEPPADEPAAGVDAGTGADPVAEIARRVDAATLHGPGIHPDRRPRLRAAPSTAGCAPTSARRSRRTSSARWSPCRSAT